MKCAICELRKPRRYCPGIRADICSICCGTERENTVDCPFDCIYLKEARAREKPNEFDNSELAPIPFSDIRVPERFVQEHEAVMLMTADGLMAAAFTTPGTIDYDVREALEALIQTYKTRESGLIYDTRPNNPLAATIYERLNAHIEDGRKKLGANTGISVRDADILAALLIIHRQEYQFNNGRKRGRAYMDHLRQFYAERDAMVNPAASPIIL
jgi:hypothetical protein